MATAHFRFGEVMGQGVPAYARLPREAETITTTTSSQTTTAEAIGGDFVTIATTGDVFVSIGANPTAASGSGDMIPAGGKDTFGPLKEGDKVAVVDA